MPENVDINTLLTEKFGQPDKMNAQREAIGLPKFTSAFAPQSGGGEEDDDPLDDIQEPIESEKPAEEATTPSEAKEPSPEWLLINESLARTRESQSRAAQELAEIKHSLRQQQQQPAPQQQAPSPEDPDYQAYVAQQRAMHAEQRVNQLEGQVVYDRADRAYRDLANKYPDLEKKIPRSRFEETFNQYARNNPGRLRTLDWGAEIKVAYDALTKPTLEKERDDYKRKYEELEKKFSSRSSAPKDSTPIPRAGRSRAVTTPVRENPLQLSSAGGKGSKPAYKSFRERGYAILDKLNGK